MLSRSQRKVLGITNKFERSILSKLKNILSKKEVNSSKAVQNLQEQTKNDSLENITTKIVINETNSEDNLPSFYKVNPKKESKSTKDPLFPPFAQLDQTYLRAHTLFSLENQLYSPFRWTPLIQRYRPSLKFHEEMYRFSKVRNWDENHTKELVDCILFEALRDTDFDYYYDYKCLPSKYCKFHGVADFLIYKKSGNHVPFVPVLLVKKKYNPVVKEKVEDLDIAPAVGAGIWSLTNMLAVDKDIQVSRTLQTTGHKWIMSEIHKDGEFKKTGVYKPNNLGTFKKIYADPEMQEVVLGLIRFACAIHSEGEIALKKAYDFIDEAKYLTELDEETKQKLDDKKKTWRFLPEGLKKFFFDYK